MSSARRYYYRHKNCLAARLQQRRIKYNGECKLCACAWVFCVCSCSRSKRSHLHTMACIIPALLVVITVSNRCQREEGRAVSFHYDTSKALIAWLWNQVITSIVLPLFHLVNNHNAHVCTDPKFAFMPAAFLLLLYLLLQRFSSNYSKGVRKDASQKFFSFSAPQLHHHLHAFLILKPF